MQRRDCNDRGRHGGRPRCCATGHRRERHGDRQGPQDGDDASPCGEVAGTARAAPLTRTTSPARGRVVPPETRNGSMPGDDCLDIEHQRGVEESVGVPVAMPNHVHRGVDDDPLVRVVCEWPTEADAEDPHECTHREEHQQGDTAPIVRRPDDGPARGSFGIRGAISLAGSCDVDRLALHAADDNGARRYPDLPTRVVRRRWRPTSIPRDRERDRYPTRPARRR